MVHLLTHTKYAHMWVCTQIPRDVLLVQKEMMKDILHLYRNKEKSKVTWFLSTCLDFALIYESLAPLQLSIISHGKDSVYDFVGLLCICPQHKSDHRHSYNAFTFTYSLLVVLLPVAHGIMISRHKWYGNQVTKASHTTFLPFQYFCLYDNFTFT